MPYVEAPPETFKRFDRTPGWSDSSQKALATDFFCMNSESNHLWNPFIYEEKDGRLFDSIRERNVAGTGRNDEAEEGVIRQLEEWFLKNDSGLGVSFSPKDPNFRGYPEDQVTIYRISYRQKPYPENGLQKILLCSSHQFNATFRNPEDLRRCVFTEIDKEESVFEIIKWVQDVSGEQIETSVSNLEERREKAYFYAYQYKSGISTDEIAYRMNQTEFLGKSPIGCVGGGSSNTSRGFGYTETITQFFGYEDQYGPLDFKCPRCHTTNTRPVGQLIPNCQYCGADVRC